MHSSTALSLAFSCDGTRVASGSGHSLRIWNALTGEIEHTSKPLLGWVQSVAFSYDGTRVASGSGDSLRISNALTGEIEHVTPKPLLGWAHSVAFSRDGPRVASGSADCSVRIWNALTGEIEHTLMGHSQGVLSIAFSRDGTCIVSGSKDKSAKSALMWNPGTGKTECVPLGRSDKVSSVTVSHHGTYVGVGLEDGSVRVWNLITRESTFLPCRESFKSPDGSKDTQIFPSNSQLFSPDRQEVILSPDRKWILTDRPRGACWIPSEFRDFLSFVVSGSKVCLRFASGRIIIVDLTPPLT